MYGRHMYQQPQSVHMSRTVHVGSGIECADEYVYVRLVYYIMLKVYVTKQIIKHKINSSRNLYACHETRA